MSASYEQLLAQRAALNEKIEAALRTEKAAAIAEARRLITNYELTERDVFAAGRPSKKTPVALPPRYRDPATGMTWTGRGRTPKWLLDVDRSKFEIQP